MTAQEWREAVEELRDQYLDASKINRTTADDCGDTADEKVLSMAALIGRMVARDLTALLNQDAADRVEEACPDCDGSGANPNSYATPPCSSCDGSGEARPGPWLALRKDTDPEFMDDVVVWKPESAHMEMMDNDSLWANFSLPNSEDLTFNVFAKKRGVLEFRLIEGPTNWRDADEARKWGEGPLGGTISRGGSESADRAEGALPDHEGGEA